ncbi:MAG: TM2 domain-containing protein [Flavobacteriales bacterium]|nr:TM2 domain-containing protein [Flavobacteriales bacterium]MBK7246149.1 TM2 domain-containing protein [Flavobacteriales bacterium]MBK9060084.1 TM2 domain-containing protein [Flavobacteriales bacterium]MBK9599436.1 TM2 domain-containing protein [Flavobacteriales bacterium]QQS71850.1 MAG: TM2 domain-containing protein [Flavobacteriales bacterium]
MPVKHLVVITGLLLTILGQSTCMAAGPFTDPAAVITVLLPVETTPGDPAQKEPQRLVAATLALTLGTFGAHRLYFGTDLKVPIIYGLTFGGFGVFVLIDLAHILFTKDLKAYMHNNKVFMWSEGRTKALTPP